MQIIFEPIQRACGVVGGQSALARAVDESPAFVSQWLRKKRQVPMETCPKIERATEGLVTCEELRPDVDWEYLSRRQQPSTATEPA